MIRASDALTKAAVLHRGIMLLNSLTPVLEYEDMPPPQEVVRALRKSRRRDRSRISAGIHVRIDGDPYDARTLRNLVKHFCKQRKLPFRYASGVADA